MLKYKSKIYEESYNIFNKRDFEREKMKIQELRFFLTGKEEDTRLLHRHANFELLVENNIGNNELLDILSDDMELMPDIQETIKKIKPKFCRYDYLEDYYKISELLSFIYASINSRWSVVRGKEAKTEKEHFYLKCGKYIYDPSLAVFVTQDSYSKVYTPIEEIENKDVQKYLSTNNNLYKYYNRDNYFSRTIKRRFSLNFIKTIQEAFNRNIDRQYELNDDNIEEIKRYYTDLKLRKVLSHRRKWELESEGILLHPDVDSTILEEIEKDIERINNIMQKKYNRGVNYKKYTKNNCYLLSILYSLCNSSFKLVQGGYAYKKYNEFFPHRPEEEFYQHSWLEKGDIIYDPEKRIVVPKNLYYRIFEKEDEYTQEETKAMLKRVGYNFTYFSHFINGRQIGNCELISYRYGKDRMNTPEKYEEGTRLIEAFEER